MRAVRHILKEVQNVTRPGPGKEFLEDIMSHEIIDYQSRRRRQHKYRPAFSFDVQKSGGKHNRGDYKALHVRDKQHELTQKAVL